MHFLNQKCETSSAVGRNLCPKLRQIFIKRCSISCLEFVRLLIVFPFSPLSESLRTSRIIKIEDGSLGKNISRASACWVKRISINFGGASVMGCNNERNRTGSSRHRSCVKESFAWYRPFNPLGKRHKVRFRSTTATQAEARERH